MGRVVIRLGEDERRVPLAAETLIGRHVGCTYTLANPAIPTFWIELRWTDDRWLWRSLVEDHPTSGPTRRHDAVWAVVGTGDAIRSSAATVVLEDASPPRMFAATPGGEEVLQPPDLFEWIEPGAEGCWPIRRGDRVEPLANGSIFAVDGRPFRLFTVEETLTTLRARLDLLHPNVFAYLDVGEDSECSLTLCQGDHRVKLSGAYVRAARPYFEARLAAGEGWLTLEQAHERWLAAGGARSDDRYRISRDRSRICRRLTAAHVAHAPWFFETGRHDGTWRTRLRMAKLPYCGSWRRGRWQVLRMRRAWSTWHCPARRWGPAILERV